MGKTGRLGIMDLGLGGRSKSREASSGGESPLLEGSIGYCAEARTHVCEVSYDFKFKKIEILFL